MRVPSAFAFGLMAAQILRGSAFSVRVLTTGSRPAAATSDLFVAAGNEQLDATITKEVVSTGPLSGSDFPGAVNDKLTLSHYQQNAAPIAASFEPSSYRPVPFLSNCHIQTIGGVFFRDVEDCAYVTDFATTAKAIVNRAMNGDEANDDDDEWFWDERQRFDTPDGDFYHVDYKYGSNNEGTVVLLHGLQSNSNSSLSIDLAKAYHHSLGMNVACMNFRGCSGVPNNKVGGYHLGFTDDLKHFLSILASNGHSSAEKPVYVSGVSLGGNVILKALGELGKDAFTKYHVHAAAVAGVPFDHERNCRIQNSNAFTKQVYIKNFVRSLQDRTKQQLELHCKGDEETDAFDYPRAMAAKTNYEWEDAVIAPVYGFKDYLDYYRQTSSIRFVDGIAVPTLVVSAEDDPLFDSSVCPMERSVEQGGAVPLKVVRTKYGGHLGYIFHQPGQDENAGVASWISTELARFVEHVHEHPLTSRRVLQQSITP